MIFVEPASLVIFPVKRFFFLFLFLFIIFFFIDKKKINYKYLLF